MRWHQLAAQLGNPEFEDFALAVTLSANGMDGSQREDSDQDLISQLMQLVASLGLEYPDDGCFTDALFPEIDRILTTLGTATVIARDHHVQAEEELALADLRRGATFSTWPGALAHPDTSFIITSFPMDTYHSVVGLTEEALLALRGDLGLEGFWAGPNTTDWWVNERGTYSYPGWLKASE